MSVLGALALGWSIGVATVSTVAIARSLRRRPAPLGELPSSTRVVVVRPCAGVEPSLHDNLASTAAAATRGLVEVWLAVESTTDPAHAALACAAHGLVDAGRAARVLVTGADAPNRKAAQLARVVDEAGVVAGDVVVVADSDVALGAGDVDRVVATLVASEDIAIAWAPPAERGPAETLADRASEAVLGASLQAFPLLASLDEVGIVGKLFAVRAEALASVGGFGALAATLGEDVALAERLRAAGRATARADVVARSTARGRSLDAVVTRFARWMLVVRSQRPHLLASYPLLFAATPLVLGVSALAARGAPAAACASAALAVGTRVGVALTARRAAGHATTLAQACADAARADALLLAAFARALGTRRVAWRRVALHVGPGGALREERA